MAELSLSDESKEESYPEFVRIAAYFLTKDPNVDPGGLNNGLYIFLEKASAMMLTVGEPLVSKQIIVLLILIYKAEHPSTELYSKHFL